MSAFSCLRSLVNLSFNIGSGNCMATESVKLAALMSIVLSNLISLSASICLSNSSCMMSGLVTSLLMSLIGKNRLIEFLDMYITCNS
uniref:Uncharacterized protein n=1 Tax=Babesia bovis TaxID=5865 RepID=S6BMN9_BABBO|nr:hypothetical protein [Babesia bovis]